MRLGTVASSIYRFQARANAEEVISRLTSAEGMNGYTKVSRERFSNNIYVLPH